MAQPQRDARHRHVSQRLPDAALCDRHVADRREPAQLVAKEVAKQQADGTPEQISDTIRYTISFCVLLGTSAVFAFFFFGPWLGRFLFQNEEVGVFLRILSFLSPFLYLETTLGSILNGLGKTSLVFFQNLAGDVIRILAILFLVPVFGIRGYLYGILASELTIMTMALLFLHRESANGFAVH